MPAMTTSVAPARTAEDEPMETERDASRVDEPGGEPPDKGLAYDPTMTDTDEANIPPDSDADPDASPESEDGEG